ncbi:MAG TPA: hypothetical protein PK847_01345 [Candidatus Sumerlaeota bacterium]|nr:hypothetical protein [Candidatus Sumerlaeota bacterium]
MKNPFSNLIAVCAILMLTASARAATINVSGGATALEDAINAASPGDTLEIADSLTYTQTARWDINKEGLKIVAASGQTPTIDLNGPATRAVTLDAGVQIGSNDGGRIKIIGRHFIPVIARSSGPGETLWENLEFKAEGDSCSVFVQVSIGPSDNPNFKFQIQRFRNCLFRDAIKGLDPGAGAIYVFDEAFQSSPVDQGGLVYVENCQFQNTMCAVRVRATADHDSTPTQVFMSDCTMNLLIPPEVTATSRGGLRVSGSSGHLTVTNCTFISEGASEEERPARFVMAGNTDFYPQPWADDFGSLTMERCTILGAHICGIRIMGSGDVNLDHIDVHAYGNYTEGAGILLAEDGDFFGYNGSLNLTNSNILCDNTFSLKGLAENTAVINATYNNVPNGIDGSWPTSSTNFSVDPQWANYPTDLTVGNPVLFSAGNDGFDIGSVELSQGGPLPNQAAHWLVY